MATDSSDPIVIGSDDESDSDDVVLIKEEIEVDCEDVIFLSETKATPKCDKDINIPSKESKNLSEDSQNSLERNVNLTTCARPLSLDDTDDNDILDTILGDTTILANGPLDLSSKSADSAEKDSRSMCATTCAVDSQNASQISESDPSFMMLLTGADTVSHACNVHGLHVNTETTANVTKQTDSKGANNSVSDTNDLLDISSGSNNICLNDQTNLKLGTSQCSLSNNSLSAPDWSAFNLSPSIQTTSANQQPDKHSGDENRGSPVLGCNDPTSKVGDGSVIANAGLKSSSSPDQNKSCDSSDQSVTQSQIVSANQTMQDLNISNSNINSLQTDASHQKPVQPRSSYDLSDPFQASHALLSSLDWTLTSGSQSQTGMLSQADQSVSNTVIQSTCQTGSVMTVDQSTNYVGGLPGGSVLCIQTPLNQQVGGSTGSDNSASSNLLKRSLSLTDTNPPYYYNSLTLQLSQQNQAFKRSLSTSSYASNSFGGGATCFDNDQLPCPRTPSPQSSQHLPPKKQKRYYSDAARDLKCTNCEVNLNGDKSSCCPNGHSTCTKCLEERVKLVLTGRAKESVKCLNKSCDSYYPISELRQSLPAMVVEILEDKLDQDYVNYISDMIMKKASEELEQDGASGDLDQLEDGGEMRYFKKYEDCPENWGTMDERDVNRDGYVLVALEAGSTEYNEVVVRFFESMVDHNVEVTGVHRVQNPIQWKYYTVKKSEMLRDSGGFNKVLEGKLFHGTCTSAVEAICRKGFDWRLCGKHGTMYGQGSYFAVNASYSHQYTDLRRPHGTLRSSMTFPQPMSMTLPTAPSLLFPPAVNFGQPLNAMVTGTGAVSANQFRPMNLSHNATAAVCQVAGISISLTGLQSQSGLQPQTGLHLQTGLQSQTGLCSQTGLQPQTGLHLQTGLQSQTGLSSQTGLQSQTGLHSQTGLQSPTGLQSLTSQHMQSTNSCLQSSSNQFGSSSSGGLSNAQQSTSGSASTSNLLWPPIISMTSDFGGQKRLPLRARRKNICSGKALPKPVAIRNISGLASTALGTNLDTPAEIEKPKARVFFARVLVGKYTTGNPKLRKPPPLYSNSDQFGKCYDSCVDSEASPKIFVVFDSTQAYPEYLLEYTYGGEKLFYD